MPASSPLKRAMKLWQEYLKIDNDDDLRRGCSCNHDAIRTGPEQNHVINWMIDPLIDKMMD